MVNKTEHSSYFDDSYFEQELNAVEGELHEVEEELQRFETEQSRSTRMLQILVFPSLIAFVLLASYGFYLVQSLTTDVHRLTDIIQKMENSVSTHMAGMSGNMQSMERQIHNMSGDTHVMSKQIFDMGGNIKQMSNDMQQMNWSTQNMAASTYYMQGDMQQMNRNVSKPFKMMNRFIPFSGSNKRSYNPPPMMPPYYQQNGYYSGWMYNMPEADTEEGAVSTSSPKDEASPQSNNQKPAKVQLSHANG